MKHSTIVLFLFVVVSLSISFFSNFPIPYSLHIPVAIILIYFLVRRKPQYTITRTKSTEHTSRQIVILRKIIFYIAGILIVTSYSIYPIFGLILLLFLTWDVNR